MKVYHETYTSAIEEALQDAEIRGFQVSDEDRFNAIGSGPGRPKQGETTRHSLELEGTEKMLHIQVYNRGDGIPLAYELNSYII